MKKEPKYARRLLKLAAFLEKLPPKRFDLRVWVGRDWAGAQDLSCGTTACALGWATTIPEFRELGARLFRAGVGLSGYVRLAGDRSSNEFTVGRRIFGLDSAETDELFYPQSAFDPPEFGVPSDATPKQVAANIRAFVKRETGRI